MNANEKAAYNAMVKKGWKVYRNGWPDFLVIKESQNKLYDIEGCAIEFKSNKTGDKLSSAQVEMHAALLKLGIPVHVMRSPAPAAIQAVERRFFNHKPMHVLVEELENVKKLMGIMQGHIDRYEREIESSSLLFEPEPEGFPVLFRGQA